MNEPTRELDAVFDRIGDRWNARRTERTLATLNLRRQRRQQRLLRGVALACVACALGAVALFVRGLRVSPALRSPDPPVAAVASDRRLQLEDGSTIAWRDERTRVVRSDSAAGQSLELLSGQARFDVVHREDRVFRVVCGELTVEVLGTSFELERDGPRTHVSVLRGRVRVSWNGGRTELSAGEAGWYPPLPEAPPSPEAPESPSGAPPPDERPPHHKRGAVAPPSGWREPAEQGDFEQAYELLARTPQPVGDDVEELLLAADTARLSGHPAAALPFLRRVIASHSRDSRAPLAAFTLGGVLMQQLGQPREAVAAYARARELSLHSSLAEDALARQVEAAHRAGDSTMARTLATEYLARYPNGRRMHAVQRFGGVAP